jgi:glycosyltransferase involved in cell wall biosynthesis
LPETQLFVVGSQPPPRLQNLAKMPGVNVTGRVPDIRPYIGKAGVSCCPIHSGTGVRLKILQSLALGTPVVTTSLGAMGLELNEDEGLFVADTDVAMSDMVIKILKDGKYSNAAAMRGRARVQERYAFARQLEALTNLHNAGLNHRAHTQERS